MSAATDSKSQSVQPKKQAHTTKSPQKNFSLSLNNWLGLMTILCVIAISAAFYARYQFDKYQLSVGKERSDSYNVTRSVPKPTFLPERTPLPDSRLVLSKVTGGESEVVLDIDKYNTNILIQHNNQLYWSEGKSIHRYDLDTGETEDLFQVEDDVFRIRYLEIINNILFFSESTYGTPGPLYAWKLPLEGEPQAIARAHNARIDQLSDQFFVIGSIGDAGYSQSTYTPLDIDTVATASPTIISDNGTNGGNQYLDLDSQNRMIFAGHTNSMLGIDELGRKSRPTYEYILARPLDSLITEEGIISKQDMPAGITRVMFDTETDTLWLLGEEAYTYDLQTKQLNLLTDIPLEWQNEGAKLIDSNSMCVLRWISGQGKGALIDAIDLEFKVDDPICVEYLAQYESMRANQTRDQETQTFIESFNLPENYSWEIK